MKRREAIKTIGALAGAATAPRLLAGCGEDGSERPAGITTMVNIMMENRTYDHYFGARSWLEGLGGDGLSDLLVNPDQMGNLISPYRETDLILESDPAHGWTASRDQWNGGAMDGFVTVHQRVYGEQVAPHPMGYLTREDLPVLYAMADSGVCCDAWFGSIMGPTWPNRMYYVAGQSNGRKDNEFPNNGGFEWPTIFHTLEASGVDYRYYYQDLPFLPLFKGLDHETHVRRFDSEFFDDAAAGTLPPVVYIDPAFSYNDDHPPHHPILGQQFLASVYAALAASPQWNNILLTITYDEHGGFFDHVPPPTAADDFAAEGFDQLGARVPTVVLGPYVKQGHVSSVVRDHSSIVAHIRSMHGFEPLTARDAAANDLSDLIDDERLAAGDPRPPVELPAVEIDESMVRSAILSRRSELVDLELAANAGHIPERFDNRDNLIDNAYCIGDRLDKLGRGRIRRGR